MELSSVIETIAVIGYDIDKFDRTKSIIHLDKLYIICFIIDSQDYPDFFVPFIHSLFFFKLLLILFRYWVG